MRPRPETKMLIASHGNSGQVGQCWGSTFRVAEFRTIITFVTNKLGVFQTTLTLTQIASLSQDCYSKTKFISWRVLRQEIQSRQRLREIRIYYLQQVRRTPGIFSKAVSPQTAKCGSFKQRVHAYSLKGLGGMCIFMKGELSKRDFSLELVQNRQSPNYSGMKLKNVDIII